jgi:Mrp family chromosome partitioning ATPase
MADLLERLSASYDMVLLDSAPLLPVTDAVVLSNLAGGALVVVGADRIHRPQLQQSLESLETAGAHLFGIVMNKIARREAAAYAYGYGYGYGSEYPSTISQPKRSTPAEARRRRDLDDTLISGPLPPNGHKAKAGRLPQNGRKSKAGHTR